MLLKYELWTESCTSHRMSLRRIGCHKDDVPPSYPLPHLPPSESPEMAHWVQLDTQETTSLDRTLRKYMAMHCACLFAALCMHVHVHSRPCAQTPGDTR